MVSPVQVPKTYYPVEQFTLPNGLRVVLAPDPNGPVIGYAVAYDVGTRSEPIGRTGFAHLFEHLMFQGSVNLEKLAYSRLIAASGGFANGSTQQDHTSFYGTVPNNALERVIFLESDRMRGPRLTEKTLRNQVDVVKEEIRVNILNRPYGGFPWMLVPPVMFDTFPNAHDSYGSFGDLEAATVDEAADFFLNYYACGNAVFSVAGDFDCDEARRMIEHHFGDLEARPAPARCQLTEPDLTRERRAVHTDHLAPLPAVAMAWRVPDPMADLLGFLPFVVLAELLAGGRTSRLFERLVLSDRTATRVDGAVGFSGEPFEVRDPTALVLCCRMSGNDSHGVLASVDEELDRLAMDGPAPGELARAQLRIVSRMLRDNDKVINRAQRLAVLAQQRGDAGILNELPHLLATVTGEQVRTAAATLRPHRRATVEVVPRTTAGGTPRGDRA